MIDLEAVSLGTLERNMHFICALRRYIGPMEFSINTEAVQI